MYTLRPISIGKWPETAQNTRSAKMMGPDLSLQIRAGQTTNNNKTNKRCSLTIRTSVATFWFLLKSKLCIWKCQTSRFFIVAKPRDHSKSLGHWMLFLVRGLKPHIDLLQGPNMAFFFEFMKSIPCCLLAAPPYVARIWLLKQSRFLLRPKIPTKNIHEWGLGEADRADI